MSSPGLSQSLEDYIESICRITGERSVVRSKEIAEERGVSPAAVSGALRALAKRGLIEYEPYGAILLTSEGRKTGNRVLRKHHSLRLLLANVAGLDIGAAEALACKIEHVMPADVLKRLVDALDAADKCRALRRGKRCPFREDA